MKRPTFVGNSKTCYHRKEETITVLDRTGFSDLDMANYLFKKRYIAQINHTRTRINATLKPLYGKEVFFSTNILSSVVDKIHYMMDATGEDIKTIAFELKAYLGKQTKFFRKQGLRKVPCESERIIRAYKSMKNNEVPDRVRSILFN